MQNNSVTINNSEPFYYFNNSATSYPKPPQVIAAVQECLQKPLLHGRGTSGSGDCIDTARRRLAKFFNAINTNDVIFTSGATESMNLVINGLNRRFNRVISTVTEHNSTLRPLTRLEGNGNFKTTFLAPDGDGLITPDQLARALDTPADAVVINHVSNVTGQVQDIAALGFVCAERGVPLVVDAAQSAGFFAIDVQAMHIAALVFTGHKCLYGLAGSGGLVLHPDFYPQPLKTGGTGVKSEVLVQPAVRPYYYESGTPNYVGAAALIAGLDYIAARGQGNMQAYCALLFDRLLDGMQQIKNLDLYYSPNRSNRAPVVCFNIRGVEPVETAYVLEHSFYMHTRPGLHCAPLMHKHLGTAPLGAVRISTSGYNTPAEIDLLLEAIDKVSAAL